MARFGARDAAMGRTSRTMSLTADAYARIRTDILGGLLQPGEKLRIEGLCGRYETGASPVREALSQLSSEGLVDRLDNRGFRVRAASARDFMELLDARCRIEENALRMAIAHGDAAWEEAILVSCHRLDRLTPLVAQEGTPEAEHAAAAVDDADGPIAQASEAEGAFEAAHRTFHTALLAGCGNRHLLGFAATLYDQAIRYRSLARIKAYPARDIAAEHKAIMQATLNRDADLAVKHLLTHYRLTGRFLDPER